MNEQSDTHANEAFNGLVLLMRLIWGRFFWPILVANAAGAVWCVASVF